MPALGKVHAHDRVAGRKEGKVDRHVRLRARVGLDIGKACAEQLFCARNGDVLDHIHAFAAAVIALARIALGVLIGQHAAHGRHNGGGNDVFAGNQLQVAPLAIELCLHGVADLFVMGGDEPDGIHQICVHIVLCSFSVFARYCLTE